MIGRRSIPRATLAAFAILAAFAAFAATACANLPPIDSHVCGNGVIDSNEDCDTFADPALGPDARCGAPSDTTRACRYVCSQTQVCPTGWACGGDGICRYSSGEFVATPESPLHMNAEHIAVARFDHDDYPDLLGISGASFELRLGAADGRFVPAFLTSSAFPTGPIAVADLDQDQRADVAVPLENGLFVMLGGTRGTLDPVAYSPFLIPDVAEGVQVLPILLDDDGRLDSTLVLVAGCAVFDKKDIAFACESPAITLPPGRLTRDLIGRIPRGNLQGGAGQELALAFAGDDHVYLYRGLDLDPLPDYFTPSLELFATISLDRPLNPEYGVAFADLDGDGDLDLLASVGDFGSDEVVVAYNSAGHFADAHGVANHAARDGFFDCAVDYCMCPDEPCAPDPQPNGARRWPLAIGPLDGDAVADIVTELGVSLRRGQGVRQTVSAPGSLFWNEAEIADFNRDGANDLAIASFAQRGIDFYLGAGGGYFNPAHVDTADPPFHLRSGDFDGDLVRDLAISEHGFAPGREEDALAVLFGRLQGAPEPPVSMGHLRHIERMEPTHLGDGPEPDLIDDLLVQSSESEVGNARTLARLFGSSQRRLLSPFVLDDGSGGLETPYSVLVGRFAGADTIPDLLAIASRLWVLKGAGEARFDAKDAKVLPLGPLFGTGPGQFDDATFCSIWASGDVDGDGSDEILAVDHGPQCSITVGGGEDVVPKSHVLVASVASGAVTGQVIDLPAAIVGPSQLVLADLDADGNRDLVIVFVGSWRYDDEGAEQILDGGVAVLWGASTGFATYVPSLLPAFPDHVAVVSVAAINADGDKQLELAIATDDGVFLHDFGSSRQLTPAKRVAEPAACELVSADVNADGLDDLVFVGALQDEIFVYTAQPSVMAASR